VKFFLIFVVLSFLISYEISKMSFDEKSGAMGTSEYITFTSITQNSAGINNKQVPQTPATTPAPVRKFTFISPTPFAGNKFSSTPVKTPAPWTPAPVKNNFVQIRCVKF